MNPWLLVARVLTCLGVIVALVVHMALLLTTGLREGFYSPAAVEVVQRLGLAMLVAVVVVWRGEAENWAGDEENL